MDEVKLKQIIKEAVKEALSEMTMNRSDYIQRVLTLSSQIAQNWCLCYFAKYISENEAHKDLLEHWATELKAHLENLEGITLKSGNKKKATYYALIEAEDLDTNSNNILNKIRYKFGEENIREHNIRLECILAYQDELPILSELISNNLDISVSEYIDEKFFG